MSRRIFKWKAISLIVSSILFLVLFICILIAPVDAKTSGINRLTTVSVQSTPTPDAIVAALEREKLMHENDWLWNYGATILTSLISALTLAFTGIFAIFRLIGDRRDARKKQEEEQQRWRKERQDEQTKRDEERFQNVVSGLGSENIEARVGAAIMLSTFLRPGYEQFYSQAFDLAVAYLRLRNLKPDVPKFTHSLSQVLIIVFKEAYPFARDLLNRSPQFLDATQIKLDSAYLANPMCKYSCERKGS